MSCSCPGINSSGPFEVVGVTNPSPSRFILLASSPVAVPYCKFPPSSKVSNPDPLGKKLPSLVDFLIVIVGLDVAKNSSHSSIF